jgi:5-formyltetrahydrofolate cyclo-ligase
VVLDTWHPPSLLGRGGTKLTNGVTGATSFLYIKSMQQTKIILRQHYHQLRQAISKEDYKSCSQEIISVFIKNKFTYFIKNSIIAGYYPIGSELNCLPLLQYFQQLGYKTALPFIEKKQQPLLFKAWQYGDPVVKGYYNILEPDVDEFSLVQPNIVLIPLLSVDKTGIRLGYGGGYYDRTLCLPHYKNVLKIGLGFDTQLCNILPYEITDIKLNAFCSEKRFITF